MAAQLSTSRVSIQLKCRQIILPLLLLILLITTGTPTWAQNSIVSPNTTDRRIETLSPIDQQFMAAQRAKVETLANQLGQQLTGVPERDLATLQRILELGLIAPDDTLQLQALGVVLGDLLATELNMNWVVYRDPAGRSRALQYGTSEVFLFPITMISRRWAVGHQRAVTDIFDTNVATTRAKLPGANWR